MSTHSLTRAHLESLASADLVALAEEYDIDVPENLNRRFIISELLEAALDREYEEQNSLTMVEYPSQENSGLPETYYETEVAAILRSPVWLYVYWDISMADQRHLQTHPSELLSLRVALFDGPGRLAPESFELPLPENGRDQYVLLPAGKKSVRLELVAGDTVQHTTTGPDDSDSVSPVRILALSPEIPLPHLSPDFSLAFGEGLSPLLELSGFRDLLHTHYLNHRECFSGEG
ncbi:MAG: DUF4912 domain-containing protein [Spirochaetaceae bacterium]|jgi:hypothetical protein|nr:DUF4912 domain-containing protein [Spirochaetaceae bacterium]